MHNKYASEQRDAFLESLRPLVEDTPAAATLNAYIEELGRLDAVARDPSFYRAAPPELRDPHAKHTWEPVAITLVAADMPKRARKTLTKAALSQCAVCGIVSNCAYPYWFRLADGIWQMAKPPCVPTK
jgi:hypothetical protein